MALEDQGKRRAGHVRPFQVHDVDRVIEILRASPEAASWSREGFLEAADEAGSLALVFEWHGALIGFLIGRLARDQAEILNLAVWRNRRREGVATLLLEAALTYFRSNGGGSAYLEVRESNAAALAFYSKHGFTAVGRRKDYYQDPVEAAVTMARKLDA